MKQNCSIDLTPGVPSLQLTLASQALARDLGADGAGVHSHCLLDVSLRAIVSPLPLQFLHL